MKLGELIPLKGSHFMTKTQVPAGKAAVANMGVLGISFGIAQSTGDTSRPSTKMPSYKSNKGQTQGSK